MATSKLLLLDNAMMDSSKAHTFVTAVPSTKKAISSQKKAGQGCNICATATTIPAQTPAGVSLFLAREYETRHTVAVI